LLKTKFKQIIDTNGVINVFVNDDREINKKLKMKILKFKPKNTN